MDNTVENPFEFSDCVRDETLDADCKLVAFDVVPPFTKIPVDLAIKDPEKEKKRQKLNASLLQRSSFPVEDIISNVTYFVFEDTFLSAGLWNSDGFSFLGSRC